MLAAGCAVEAVDKVVRGEVRHSLALIRYVFHNYLAICKKIISESYQFLFVIELLSLTYLAFIVFTLLVEHRKGVRPVRKTFQGKG